MLEQTKLGEDTVASRARGRTWPTPIWVPKRLRNVLVVVSILAVLAALVFVAWRVPSTLIILAGALRSPQCSRHPCGLSRASCQEGREGWRL